MGQSYSSDIFEPFDYEPLKKDRSIRLLEIPPSSSAFWGIPAYSLTEHELHALPQYEAISYSWGDAPFDQTILINGNQFEVSITVKQILTTLARPDCARLICIYSICINQKDDNEKTVQIPLMRPVYQHATVVNACLGRPDDADSAISLLNELVRFPLDSEYIDKWELHEKYNGQQGSPRWTALTKLLSQPWFGRVWVVQEVALASKITVHYGHNEVSWEKVMNVILTLTNPSNHTFLTQKKNGIFSSIIQVKALVMGGVMARFQRQQRASEDQQVHVKLYDALISCRNSQATYPVDQIFGLLGLIPNTGIAIDYRASVKEIYTKACDYILAEEKFCSVLSYAGSRSQDAGFPSWVPNWDPDDFSNDVRFLTNHSKSKIYSTASKYRLKYRGMRSSDCIQIGGVVIDEIEHLAAIVPPESKTQTGDSLVKTSKARRTVRNASWELATQILGSSYSKTNQPLKEAFWRTLIGDTWSHKFPAPASVAKFYDLWQDDVVMDDVEQMMKISLETSNPYEVDFQKLFNILGARAFDPNVSKKLGENSMLISQWMGGVEAAMSRRFAISKNQKLIGLVPGASKPGDIVCAIMGSQVPFLLRPVPKGEDVNIGTRYELVGECYIHGIMSGITVHSDAVEWLCIQ